MGSLTRGSLAAIPQLVAGEKSASASELFAVGRTLHDQPALVRALGDDSASAEAKKTLVDTVFAGVSAGTRKLVGALASSSWSEPADLLNGVEEAGIRLAATRAGDTDLAGQLLAVDRVIKSNPDVQLALSGKRAPVAAKQSMVEGLFGKKVSADALAIVTHLVVQPRDRRITQSIAKAAETVCDERGEGLAEVRVASQLSAANVAAISDMLEAQYGRPHYIDQVIDPEMVGGVRIRVGDHVIDQSVATQLATMRRQLAS